MIDLNLKRASLDAPDDISFRYYEPATPTDGADRWHLGTAIYRLALVAVPLDGSEPIVALMRQTGKGRDYARGGRSVHTLRHIASVLDGDVNRISAHVQQVRDALVRVALDEQRAAAEAGFWTAPAISVDESGPMIDKVEPYVDPETGWSEPLGEEHQPLDGDDDEEALDATMREQMAAWPDDTLALVTLGELRTVLLRAFDTGAARRREGLDVVDGLLRELPTERPLDVRVDVRDVSALKADPTLTGEEVRAVAFGELPDVGRPESFEVPGSAYDGVLGYDRHTHAAVTETAGRVTFAVAELRRLLRVAHDHGAGLDDEADCDAFLDDLVARQLTDGEER